MLKKPVPPLPVVEACQSVVAFNAKHQPTIEHEIEARLSTDKAAVWLKVHGATKSFGPGWSQFGD